MLSSRASILSGQPYQSPVRPVSTDPMEYREMSPAHATIDQIHAFFEEFLYFVDMTDLEHQVVMSGILPSVAEYQQRRMGSSAVGLCLAITEWVIDLQQGLLLTPYRYCFGMEIPVNVMRDEDMKVVWKETNNIISVYVSAVKPRL